MPTLNENTEADCVRRLDAAMEYIRPPVLFLWLRWSVPRAVHSAPRPA